jgi:hypothetical protein
MARGGRKSGRGVFGRGIVVWMREREGSWEERRQVGRSVRQNAPKRDGEDYIRRERIGW